jgi:hypothetical protein
MNLLVYCGCSVVDSAPCMPQDWSLGAKVMRSLVNNCALPIRSHTTKHEVPIYLEYHSVCPLVGIVTPLPSLPQASVLPPRTKGGGGHTRLRVRGWGSPNSDDWRESLELCLL